ncbi:MAG: hypothetical protein F6K47_07565, partial [Symploca sp. SIO2E6]|nr:hypothetical protein [Symploca sp. SIO2E6]
SDRMATISDRMATISDRMATISDRIVGLVISASWCNQAIARNITQTIFTDSQLGRALHRESGVWSLFASHTRE